MLKINKKGILGIPVTELIYLIITIGVILLLVTIGVMFYSFFVKDRDYDETVNHFNVLTDTISALINDGEEMSYTTLLYFMGENSIVVGFSSGSGQPETSITKENIERPQQCGESACLCIYKNGKFKGSLPLKCALFKQQIIFLSTPNAYSSILFQNAGTANAITYKLTPPPNYNYAHLVLYGSFVLGYGVAGIGKSTSNFGVKNIYIDKAADKDKLYIFITKDSENNDWLNQRKAGIKKSTLGADTGTKN